MKAWSGAVVTMMLLGIGACSRNSDASHAADKLEPETKDAAHKAGQAAYRITQEAKDVARKAAKKLDQAGKDAKSGWDDAKKKSQSQDHK